MLSLAESSIHLKISTFLGGMEWVTLSLSSCEGLNDFLRLYSPIPTLSKSNEINLGVCMCKALVGLTACIKSNWF